MKEGPKDIQKIRRLENEYEGPEPERQETEKIRKMKRKFKNTRKYQEKLYRRSETQKTKQKSYQEQKIR